MPSLPYPEATAPPCTNAHVDGCPNCVLNSEAPEHTERLSAGCVAAYVCTDCGHNWTTSWACA